MELEPAVGECRRYPSPLIREGAYWCGEFNAKPAGKTIEAEAKLSKDFLNKVVALWESRLGPGSGMGMYGRLGKAFKPLVIATDEETLLNAFAKYLSGTEVKFISPEAFANKVGSWITTFQSTLKPKAEAPVAKSNEDYDKYLKGLGL